MAVPDAAVNFLIENLSQVLKYNYHLIADVRDNIVNLQKELKKLKGLMNDYEKYNYDSDYLKEMVLEVRTVLYKAEDAVDTYLLHSAVQNVRGWLSKTFHKFTDYPKVLRDVGKQIEEIGAKVKKINEEKDNAINLLQHQAIVKLGQSPKPKEAPTVEEEHVVGFDGAAKSMKKLLLEGPEKFEAISIVGMLGLGKTTLAKMVYKDKDVDYEFMIQAFVYVSKEYEKKEVFLKILSSMKDSNNEVNTMSVEELEEYLKTKLTGSSYLIVLDDVWEIDDWKKLEGAFPKNSKRCRVLITTRNEKVAEYANDNIPFYRLKFLPLEKSADLLRWKVFKSNVCPEELKDYEKSIVEKCNGLPLAIVVIAGIIWSRRHRVDWWKHVADSVKDYIARDHEQTTKVIEVMYQYLPHHLKPCFIYLGVFREDFEIPVWKLVRLWIAEGLVQQEGDFNLEDMAEQYLEELAYRNLVMVSQKRSNNKIKTCHIHDTLREFCKNEAIEANFFQEIKKNKLSFFSSGNPALDEYRRLCINNANVLDYISAKPSGKCVRSFLTFAKEETTVDPKFVSSIPKTFKLLRVLEIESLIFTRFPVDLSHLFLLKYIAVSVKFSSLPSAMSTMQNMQTLIVKSDSRCFEIKADIWQMPQLRHVHTNASTILPSPDATNQKRKGEASIDVNVQTLSTISPKSCTKEVFDRTPKLKKLGIFGRITDLFHFSSSLFASLGESNSIENLKLLNDGATSISTFSRLPSYESFPEQLTELTLLNTFLDWKEMSTLGKLKKLEVLKLKDFAFQGREWHTGNGGFLILKHLHIGSTDMESWEASADDFPRLERLQLNNCGKLKAVPEGLADIPTLQLLSLHCTNDSVARSARDLKEGNENRSFKLSVYPPDQGLSNRSEI